MMKRTLKQTGIIFCVLLTIALLSSSVFAAAPNTFGDVTAIAEKTGMTETIGLPFTDVPENAWYFESVRNAYEWGLIDGKTLTTFAPEDNMTVAEALKLAACMHQSHRNGVISLRPGTIEWYQPYIDYCFENGIISEANNEEYGYFACIDRADEKITREEYALFFSRALPDEVLPAIASFPDNSIPDVPTTNSVYNQAIYKLYRSGILIGSDSLGTFHPKTNIKRSEVATVLVRLMDAETSWYSQGEGPEDPGVVDPGVVNPGVKKTITVSTIQELAEAINSNTHIILKAGEYNFSDLKKTGYNNPNLIEKEGYSIEPGFLEYTIQGVKNMLIEADHGAKVEIVTENSYAKAFEFHYCSAITLKGLTCGHKTTPGTCLGSVIYAKRSNGLVIEDCKLYGCGTYGLEAYQSENISVHGTEIYECSDAIVYLDDTHNTTFSNCHFHDNKAWSSALSISGSYGIVFEDTEMNNNLTNGVFIKSDYYDTIYFRNCVFHDNETEPLMDGSEAYIEFVNCEINGESIGESTEAVG